MKFIVQHLPLLIAITTSCITEAYHRRNFFQGSNFVERHFACVSPFIYDNTEYRGCTNVNAPDFWCSTAKVYNGNWRYCPKKANEDDVPENVKGHPDCIFPFIYKNTIYSKCVKNNNDEYWCSTTNIFIPGSDNWEKCTIEIETYPSSCKQYQEENKENGIYKIQVGETVMKVYCDISGPNDSDSWIVIQRRINGAVSFARTWDEYKNGFGDLNAEFWLGNDKLHNLTNAAPMKIRFDLWDKDDNHRYAEYSLFSIQSEGNNYKLSVSGYSGNAGNSMSYENNMIFSTYDRDNDEKSDGSCSHIRGYSGWWHKNCIQSNVNGEYLTTDINNGKGVFWYQWKGKESLKKTIIKIAYL